MKFAADACGRATGRLAAVACLRATDCGRLPAPASGRRRVRAGGTDPLVRDRVQRWEISFEYLFLLPVPQSHQSGIGVRRLISAHS